MFELISDLVACRGDERVDAQQMAVRTGISIVCECFISFAVERTAAPRARF